MLRCVSSVGCIALDLARLSPDVLGTKMIAPLFANMKILITKSISRRMCGVLMSSQYTNFVHCLSFCIVSLVTCFSLSTSQPGRIFASLSFFCVLMLEEY